MQREAFDSLDAPILRISGRDVPDAYNALPLEEQVLARAEHRREGRQTSSLRWLRR